MILARTKSAMVHAQAFITLVLILIAHPAPSQVFTPRPGGKDAWTPAFPAGGGVAVGFMTIPQNGALDPTRAWVQMPERHGTVLCLAISARDGRYAGEFVYDIPSAVSGWVGLSIPTRYRVQLSRYSKAELVLLARESPVCEGGDAGYFVTSWDRSPSLARMLLYVNSRDPTLINTNVDRSAISSGCEEIPESHTAAFNRICSLDPRGIRPGSVLVINRRNGFQWRRPFRMTVAGR